MGWECWRRGEGEGEVIGVFMGTASDDLVPPQFVYAGQGLSQLPIRGICGMALVVGTEQELCVRGLDAETPSTRAGRRSSFACFTQTRPSTRPLCLRRTPSCSAAQRQDAARYLKLSGRLSRPKMHLKKKSGLPKFPYESVGRCFLAVAVSMAASHGGTASPPVTP